MKLFSNMAGMRIYTPLLVLLLALVSVALGSFSGYDYGFDTSHVMKRQLAEQQQPYVITGIPGNGTLPFRKEIRALQQDQDQWNLYILGLSMMQYTDQDQELSFYQIAGIHGVPFEEWNGVGPTPGNSETGYCQHLSILFPTWHRVYLALFEQVLFQAVQQIAGWFPVENGARQRYQAAAASFRIPYYDWALEPPAGQSVLPDSVGASAFITVSGPNGVQTIANPLFTYEFKPLNTTAFIQSPWTVWPTTLRGPDTSNITASEQSNNTYVAEQLNGNLTSYQQQLYTLFSNYPNYSTFSNERSYWADHDVHNSIENLHDTIHTVCGGESGHMAYIPFSSFDPIFFLHHTMVDRVVAMWQVLYPDSWVTPTPAWENSFTTSSGQIQDSSSPLTPFYADSNGTFWTSDMVRDPGVLGYTYADIAPYSVVGGNNSTQAQSQVAKIINRLYGSSSVSNLATLTGLEGSEDHARRSRVPGRANERRISRSALPGSGTHHENSGWSSSASKMVIGGKYQEWIAKVRVNKMALNGPFFINLLLDQNKGTSGPDAISKVAGTMGIFASTDDFMKSNQTMMEGAIMLTAALADRVVSGELPGLDADSVKPYLEQRLECQVVQLGAVVDTSMVDGLQIRIMSAEVQAPASDEKLPRWGQIQPHFDLV